MHGCPHGQGTADMEPAGLHQSRAAAQHPDSEEPHQPGAGRGLAVAGPGHAIPEPELQHKPVGRLPTLRGDHRHRAERSGDQHVEQADLPGLLRPERQLDRIERRYQPQEHQGTRAADFPDLDPQIKKVRTKEMMDLSYKLERRYNSNFIDKTLDVIFEQKDSKGRIVGHSSNFIEVVVLGDESLIGKYANVHITKVEGIKLIGEITSFID